MIYLKVDGKGSIVNLLVQDGLHEVDYDSFYKVDSYPDDLITNSENYLYIDNEFVDSVEEDDGRSPLDVPLSEVQQLKQEVAELRAMLLDTKED